MIYFNFNICYYKWRDRFENIKCWTGKTPFNHKFWEFQIIKNDKFVCFEFEITTHQDHAGIRLELGILGYEVDFNLYDSRHWNAEQGYH
jgi:hypothetical protein